MTFSFWFAVSLVGLLFLGMLIDVHRIIKKSKNKEGL